MATRDEILRELGLAPAWRRRASGTAGATDAADVVARSVAPGIVTVEDPSARRARIATLDWDALDADIAACTACPLCRSRKRTVPGVGDRAAEWLFVGEGPGAEEDVKGEPFVGQAGRLLDSMLAAIASTSRTSSSAGRRTIARPSPARRRRAGPTSSGRSRCLSPG